MECDQRTSRYTTSLNCILLRSREIDLRSAFFNWSSNYCAKSIPHPTINEPYTNGINHTAKFP